MDIANDESSGCSGRPPDQPMARDDNRTSHDEYARKRIVVEKMPPRMTNIRDELEYTKQRYHDLKKITLAESEQVRLGYIMMDMSNQRINVRTERIQSAIRPQCETDSLESSKGTNNIESGVESTS
jgi:hypothetical protein